MQNRPIIIGVTQVVLVEENKCFKSHFIAFWWKDLHDWAWFILQGSVSWPWPWRVCQNQPTMTIHLPLIQTWWSSRLRNCWQGAQWTFRLMTIQRIHGVAKPIVRSLRMFLSLRGFLVLEDKRLRDLMDIKILWYRWRCVLSSSGSSVIWKSVTALTVSAEQYLGVVKPMYHQFIEPTKRYADIVIPRGVSTVAIDLWPPRLQRFWKKRETVNIRWGAMPPFSIFLRFGIRGDFWSMFLVIIPMEKQENE